MSLFFKIFVWFWLAMASVTVALVVTTSLAQSGPVVERWRYATGTAVRVYAQTAVDIYEREGNSALVVYLQRVDQTAQMRAALFDDRGQEVAGRGATTGARRLAARTSGVGEAQFEFPDASGTATLIAQSTYGRGGARYVLVSEVPRDRFSALHAEPSAFVLPLAAVLLTGGVVCYALARHLTAPLAALRMGVRRLAGGDLSARLGTELGARGDEIADLSRDFDLMAERLEALMLAQRRLLGDISHELRSPLARLNVALELARQRAGESAHGALDRIGRETERLNELIGQLLTLTRLEIGSEEVEKTEVDLKSLVGEIAANADFEASSRRRRVHFVARGGECTVVGNEDLLASAVENVVRNAARYTAEDTAVDVTLSCRRSGGGCEAVIEVRDHGRGVPEEALGELFRPFYRVADARERRTGGTGLGLAITERAVKLHGGTVKAENADGGGLVVEIHLPAAAKK